MSTEFLGYPIVNKCPCGARVSPKDPQQLVWDEEHERWMRACMKCIKRTKPSYSMRDFTPAA